MTDIDALLEQVSDPGVREALRALIHGSRPRADEREVAEYQLSYAGKEPEAEILLRTPALPLQLTRAFGKLGEEAWHNVLIQGDNLPALRRLVQMKAEGLVGNADGSPGVRLAYIDPPFASEEDYETKAGKVAYSDKVKGAEFIEGIRKRLVLIRELLSDDGSIFVHLDWRKSHYIKIVMDEIFGEHNFANEIIWHYKAGSVGKTSFGRKHDTVLRYVRRQGTVVFNADAIRIPYAESTIKRLSYAGAREKDIEKVLARGGKVPTDVWEIGIVQGNSAEDTGYPTQKPEELVGRIIAASSNPGDVVLDCFVGSGTALAAAEKLDRRWIGVDMALSAIYTCQKRLLDIASSKVPGDPEVDAGKKALYGRSARAFGVYSSGHYDFARLRALPFADYRTFVLRLFGAREEPEDLNGFRIDGRHRGHPVIVFDYTGDPEAQVTPDFFPELAEVLGRRAGDRVLFIAPASRLAFFQDEITTGGITFEVRRVPYSIINAMRRRGNQPTSEADIRKMIESEGFDFVIPPRVKLELDPSTQSLTITDFHSFALAKRLTDEDRGMPAIAMVLIDYNHDGHIFDLDSVVFADQLTSDGFRVKLDGARTGEVVAVSICDIFGNEHIEVFADQTWGQQ